MHNNPSRWRTRLNEDMIARYTDNGNWRGITLAQSAEDRARDTPDQIAVINGDIEVNFAELYARAVRLATSLERRGLRAGDVISFQLPNWHECLVINLAASIKGYICNPIVPIYRDAEVGFILQDAGTKILFVPQTFRSIDYVAMVERLRPNLPELQDVVLVRSDWEDYNSEDYISYESLIAEDIEPDQRADIDPNAIKLLLYTSGTTGKPKGVLHSDNTLRAEIDAVTDFWALDPVDVMLMPSPVTHITGYLYALELPFATGVKAVLMDRWNANDAVGLIIKHDVTVSIGSTPFLIELVTAAEGQARTLSAMRLFGCGGAPVPPDVVLRARRILPNCTTFRIYGSSEAPTVSLGLRADDPVELGATTDGRIFNHEVLIVDAVTSEPLPLGCDGEVITRGPEVMLGYTDWEETIAAFDEQGFFHTGDLGFITNDMFITISGRKKDIIIRGGENLSAKEIEDVLHCHPAISEAAVVAAPHSRLGETPVVYVVLRDGMSLNHGEITAFLEEARLARQKFPEQLIVVQELPRTASGKVLKHILRARSREMSI